MAFSLRARAHSEIGLVRDNNQDSAYVSPSMILVADGMGGAAAGDLASSVAVREMRRVDDQNRSDSGGERLVGERMLEALSGALTRANDKIADLVANDRALEGMGTTVCGAMFSGTQYGICHIGDSRGYLVRDGEFRRLTTDHSWVQSLVDEGKITEQEAAEHPHRSLLLKVLNGQPSHTADYELLDAQLGDRLLFCSDGLSAMVDDDVIERLLTGSDDLDAVVRSLTDAARSAGGLDNITVVVADVVEPDEALETVQPRVLGAAETMKIPKVESTGIIAELKEDTRRLPIIRSVLGGSSTAAEGATTQPPPVAAAPAGATPASVDQPPAGLIDPDAFESIRYSPHVPSRGRRLLPVITTILAVLAVGLAVILGGRAYVNGQYFIGPDDLRVAVYQGVPEQILGKELWTKLETSPIRVADLPPYYAGRVEQRELRYGSLDEAHEELANLGRMAERCIAERAQRAATASPSPPGGEDGSAGPTGESPNSADGEAASAAATSPGAMTRPSPTGTPTGTTSPRPDLEACG